MSPDEIWNRLQNISPRSRQLLALRVLRQFERHTCADFLGISEEAFDLHFLRAVHEFSGLPPFNPGLREELANAATLKQSPWPSILEDMSRYRLDLLKRPQAEALRSEQSGEAARRRLGERVLFVLLLALTAFFYLRGHS